MKTATTHPTSPTPTRHPSPPRSGVVRVMIVEDSAVIRELLTCMISRDPRLEIVAVVGSGERALSVMNAVRPDVISMDIRLPGIDGLETTRRVMAESPTPIVVVAANAEAEESRISMNALQAGALAVLEKPVGTTTDALEAFGQRLCTQLAIMSRVKVITRRPIKPLTPIPAPDRAEVRRTNLTPAHTPAPRPHQGQHEMLGVVASTGGPNALVQLFRGLGSDFPLPILLVQHITSCFAKAFVEWLDDVCGLRVVEAADGIRPQPGHIYAAPADQHLVLRARRLRLTDGPLVSMQRPSGTILLQSMAEDLRASALGVVLTGMGDDGAAGLRAIRDAGGHTIAEHESTAVVYGMPAAAAALGAAREQLPLPMIAPRLSDLVNP